MINPTKLNWQTAPEKDNGWRSNYKTTNIFGIRSNYVIKGDAIIYHHLYDEKSYILVFIDGEWRHNNSPDDLTIIKLIFDYPKLLQLLKDHAKETRDNEK